MSKYTRKKNKPKLFIASSSENLSIANALQSNLFRDIERTVWNQGVIKPSQYTLQALLKEFSGYDFAAFVFNPDDSAIIRSKELSVVRDNVLFELGMFVSIIGVERCFVLTPEGVEVHLPTDIIGLSPIVYDESRSDNNIQAAVEPASSEILRVIEKVNSDKRNLSKDTKKSKYC